MTTEADGTHRRTLQDRPGRQPVTVYFGDDIIATSGHALVLREEGAEPVFYLPRDRVELAFLVDSDRRADSNDEADAASSRSRR